MHEAGLTRGGFYKHFESKDQLVAEATALSVGFRYCANEGNRFRS